MCKTTVHIETFARCSDEEVALIMTKNYYMVQASNTYGSEKHKAAYLPYATGLLVAYANSHEQFKDEYCFKRFIFTRENISSAVSSLEEPFLVGFSNYIWNTEYNKALAAAVKERFPSCYIIFGGHNVPPDTSFLEQYDYIDFLIHGEGEEAFCALLAELAKDEPDFSRVPNLSWREGGRYCQTAVEVLTGTDYPSPYLTGVFDDIMRDYPDMQHDAILETSRGCPRNCAYCDWGCTNSGVKAFPIERVKAEIDWFAENKVAFLWGADANFGHFERDSEIADYIVETRRKTGYPERIRINYSKGNKERVFAITKAFERVGVSKEGATLSFQSLNPQVLKNIGRCNMDLESFKRLMNLYLKEKITSYSELILGLPGETYASFCAGIGTLLAAGQHRMIHVYNCELLPNSPLASPEYIDKFGIKAADVVYRATHSNMENEVNEKSHYIVSTNTMSTEEWVRANIFACFEKSLHHYGPLKYIAIYMFEILGVRYEDFYNAVVDWAASHPDSLSYKTYAFLNNLFKRVSIGEPIELYRNPVYGEITWPPDHVAVLDVIDNLDRYYAEMRPFFLSFGVDEEIFDELIDLQHSVLKQPGAEDMDKRFKYNWREFFKGVFIDDRVDLKEKASIIHISNADTPSNWQDYARESIWFGKNGMTINNNITVTYILAEGIINERI